MFRSVWSCFCSKTLPIGSLNWCIHCVQYLVLCTEGYDELASPTKKKCKNYKTSKNCQTSRTLTSHAHRLDSSPARPSTIQQGWIRVVAASFSEYNDPNTLIRASTIQQGWIRVVATSSNEYIEYNVTMQLPEHTLIRASTIQQGWIRVVAAS